MGPDVAEIDGQAMVKASLKRRLQAVVKRGANLGGFAHAYCLEVGIALQNAEPFITHTANRKWQTCYVFSGIRCQILVLAGIEGLDMTSDLTDVAHTYDIRPELFLYRKIELFKIDLLEVGCLNRLNARSGVISGICSQRNVEVRRGKAGRH